MPASGSEWVCRRPRPTLEAPSTASTDVGLVTLRGPDVAQVRRPALMAALAAVVPPSVRFETGPIKQPGELDADLVVGADGVRSQVRGLVNARS